ncbi:MAG: hypothetical protein Q9168_004579 [Polycauliona sp. 1 TL-2023]
MTADAPHETLAAAPGKKIDFCESWYDPEIKNLPLETRRLFEQYSNVPADEVIDHIQRMRSRAFAIYPYPCIGQLRFLNLSLSRHPLYPDVVARLRPKTDSGAEQRVESLSISGKGSGISYMHSSPQLMLDLGCCLAQDLRKLVFDGVPSEKLYGLDVEKGFIDLSYDLFKDHATLKSHFLIEDMLFADVNNSDNDLDADSSSTSKPLEISTPASTSLASLENRMSIIVTNSIFHLYNYADQLRLAKRVVRLLSPERGSLILGRQVGSSQPGEYTAVNNQGTRYAHDATSFRHFWDRVAEDVGDGCKFRVEAILDEEELGHNKNQGTNWSEPNIRRMRFGVWRE